MATINSLYIDGTPFMWRAVAGEGTVVATFPTNAAPTFWIVEKSQGHLSWPDRQLTAWASVTDEGAPTAEQAAAKTDITNKFNAGKMIFISSGQVTALMNHAATKFFDNSTDAQQYASNVAANAPPGVNYMPLVQVVMLE